MLRGPSQITGRLMKPTTADSTVPAARLKVLPFMELWTGENQFNMEPTRGSCLSIPYNTWIPI